LREIIMKKMLKIIVMLLVTAAVVFAAGCAQKPETAGNETPKMSNVTGENVTGNYTAESNMTEVNKTAATGQIVTEADNGTSISLKNGENFTLQLRENPSKGYSWQLNLTEGLSILRDKYTQDSVSENATGVPGTHSWVIEAVAPGSQQVNGIYKRSWENTTGTEQNFTLNVEVV
jgi:inhibitor of cysteine peptidase